MFDIYRDLYYEGGVSSVRTARLPARVFVCVTLACGQVYCWDVDVGFAACILIKKSTASLSVADQSDRLTDRDGARAGVQRKTSRRKASR